MIDLRTSPSGASPIVLDALFPASPARLFRAWTTPQDLMRWFGTDPTLLSRIDLDLRIGGAWRFHMNARTEQVEYLHGTYLRIDPDQALAFTWAHVVESADGARRETPPSQVIVTFTPNGKATRLVLEHRDISTEGGRIGVRDGWITSLQTLHATLPPSE